VRWPSGAATPLYPDSTAAWRCSSRRRPGCSGVRVCIQGLVLLSFTIVCCGLAPAADFEHLRGDRVGWARLKTPGEHWNRHSQSDPVLMQFVRENTSLNIDPTWYAADSESLEEMSKYPLLFSQDIYVIRSRKAKAGLAEYLRRGGFLLIDSCCNRGVTASEDLFLNQQRQLLTEILPEASVVSLPSSHPVYRCYFQIPEGRPPHTFFQNVYDPNKARHGLYGIQIGTRLAGIISLSGLQCGWDKQIAPAGHDVKCMKMLVNIYVYAMIQVGSVLGAVQKGEKVQNNLQQTVSYEEAVAISEPVNMWVD
jgi:hypothetical protein